MSARYVPGRWLAVRGPDCWALLDLRPDDPRAAAVAAAVDGPAPVDAVLSMLLAGGLGAVPGFAVVARAGASLRYLVRHPATLRVDGVLVAPTADLTWTDALTDGLPTEVILAAGGVGSPPASGRGVGGVGAGGLGAGGVEAGGLALDRGVVAAERVTVSLVGASGSGVPTTPPAELIDGVPWATGPTAAPAGPPPPSGPAPRAHPDDLPSATRLRQPYAPSPGPTVWAVRCPAGHLTSPYSPLCRVCATPVPEQPPVQVVRPPLGRLVLTTGLVVTLDRGVVLGRSPQPTGGGQPYLVAATEATEVSRSHAEVRLADWHVLLRDLGSANGTVLTLPGRRPEQIRPGEDHHLEPGATVSLADVVGFRFEVTG